MNKNIFNREPEQDGEYFKLPADGWFQIEANGEHPALRGKDKIVQVIDDSARSAMVANFNREREEYEKQNGRESFPGFCVDVEHHKHDPEKEGKARAWLMDLRNTGKLEGKLRLTKIGRDELRSGEWRFFSTEYQPGDFEPVANRTADGVDYVRPLRLDGLTFTNMPNNKGGRPATNRAPGTGSDSEADSAIDKLSGGDSSAGEPEPKTEIETDTHDMKKIAELLGLSEDASEEDILAAATELQTKADAAEAAKVDAEVEEILNTHKDKIPTAFRPVYKQQLIANREDTLANIEALPESGVVEGEDQDKPAPVNNTDKNTPTASEIIANRGKHPKPVANTEDGADSEAESKRADLIQNRARELRATVPHLKNNLSQSYRDAEASIDAELAAAD